MLRHVGFCPAWFAFVKQAAGFVAHEIGRAYFHIGLGDGELDALIGADGAIEDDAFRCVTGRAFYEPVAIANTFGRNQRAFGIEPVEDVTKALPLLPDQTVGGQFQPVEEDLVRLVIYHVAYGADFHAVADGPVKIDEEDGQPLGLLCHLLARGRAGEQDHEVGMLDAADPDLLARDDIAIAPPHRARLEFGGVGAGGRLGHGHRLQADVPACDGRKIALLLLCRAMPQQGVHIVHLPVAGARIATCPIDFLHDDGGFGQPQPRPSVFLGDKGGHPAFARQRFDKFLGIFACFVHLAEIAVAELPHQGAHGRAEFGKVVTRSWDHHGQGFRGKQGDVNE